MAHQDGETEDLSRLLELARRGDEIARSALLRQLSARMRPEIERLLSRKLRVRCDGSDLVQNLLMQIARDLPQFCGDSEGALLSWVRRILEHDIQGMLQREKYAAKRSVDREVNGGHEVHEAPGRQTSPSRRLIRGEHKQIVRIAFDQLDEEWREVMRLKHFDELTMADIARRLDKSESTVARLLVKGMRELKVLLKRHGITDS